jgi:hypothetical protein
VEQQGAAVAAVEGTEVVEEERGARKLVEEGGRVTAGGSAATEGGKVTAADSVAIEEGKVADNEVTLVGGLSEVHGDPSEARNGLAESRSPACKSRNPASRQAACRSRMLRRGLLFGPHVEGRASCRIEGRVSRHIEGQVQRRVLSRMAERSGRLSGEAVSCGNACLVCSHLLSEKRHEQANDVSEESESENAKRSEQKAS